MVAVMLAGSSSMAQHGGGGYKGNNHGSRGELFWGLLGIGVAAAIVSTIERPRVYVQDPVYQMPQVVQQPIVVQQQPQAVYVQQPQAVYQSTPVFQQVIQQPAQVAQYQPVTILVSIQNSNGSYTPVTLHHSGAHWVGPYGEHYRTVPSVRQLRPMYGR